MFDNKETNIDQLVMIGTEGNPALARIATTPKPCKYLPAVRSEPSNPAAELCAQKGTDVPDKLEQETEKHQACKRRRSVLGFMSQVQLACASTSAQRSVLGA